MKKVMFDHFRRWWWVWLFGVIVGQLIAISMCMPGMHEKNARPVFVVVIFLGPFLLSFDLQRGHSRALMSMPVTTRQIARAWWLATVAIPSLAMAVIIGVAVAFVMTVSPGPIAYLSLLNYWLINSFLIGAMFFALTGLPVGQGVAEGRDRVWGYFFGILWGAMFGSWFLLNNWISIEGASGLIFCALAGALTVAGWFRAERLVTERAGLRERRPSLSKNAEPWRGREGYGGMRYLFQALFQRLVIMGIWMFVAVTAFFWLMHLKAGFPFDVKKGEIPILPVLTFQLLWIMSFQVMPVIFHIRFLRTLPVSTGKLACLLVFTPLAAMLLVVYLANLLMKVIFEATWFSPLEIFSQGYFLQIALASWFIPMMVWRGIDRQIFAIVIFGMILATAGTAFFANELIAWVGDVIALFLIPGSFLVTKLLLERNSRVYRPRAQFAGWNWSVSR